MSLIALNDLYSAGLTSSLVSGNFKKKTREETASLPLTSAVVIDLGTDIREFVQWKP